MKNIALLLLFVALGLSTTTAFAQSRSSDKSGLRKSEVTTTVFLQIIAEEELNSPEVKMRAILGKDNQFYVKDKRDFEVFDVLSGEISKFTLIADALNYLSERGFILEGYSTNTIGDRIRHTIILSRTTTM